MAIFVFGLLTAILLVVDASTGGRIKPKGWSKTHKTNDFSSYGNYNTDGMIPIYCITGIAYGMVELIRRVIPKDIVGGNVQKLRRMDAVVHIFYEVSGTAGAFCTALGLIPGLGNNMSFIITPICFTLAGITWFFVSNLSFKPIELTRFEKQPSYIKATFKAFYLFVESAWTGGKNIFSSRKFVWLLLGYTVGLYAHRYLENSITPAIARRYLGNSAWSQIMVGGSNFLEHLGALFVFLFTNVVTTPIPWLRLDCLMLLIVWYLPYWYPPMGQVSQAWVVAGTFIPISFGWAAGDVSLAAYIQALLARQDSETSIVSALGAVMAFLYSTYIVIYAITSPLLGRYIDSVYAATGGSKGGDIHGAIQNVAGVQFTIVMAVIMLATFIPKGSMAFNPKDLYGERLDTGLEDRGDCESAGEEIEQGFKKDATVQKGAEVRIDAVGEKESLGRK